MKIISIVGARPQFIKLAPLSSELRKSHQEIIIHTGQHYDRNMSDIFFDALHIPEPDYNLNIHSNSHGIQTGRMLSEIEGLLMQIKPDVVIVFGDTNSTLAGALAAAKLHIPVAHVEAGMRSFNKSMPEEINRIVTDHLADILLCSSRQSAAWLANENIKTGITIVGDLMIDALIKYLATAPDDKDVLSKFRIEPHSYSLATIHRAENTDQPKNLKNILLGLSRSAQPILLPLHPRSRKVITQEHFQDTITGSNILIVDPVPYHEMLILEKNAQLILTDSGGMQKEAYFFKVPCITLRTETEWVETLQAGWNTLAAADADRIASLIAHPPTPKNHGALYGSGNAAQLIVEAIEQWHQER